MSAIRIWKRDHSTNAMSLDMAAENIKSRCVDDQVRQMTLTTIRDRLLRGYRFETPHALFELSFAGSGR